MYRQKRNTSAGMGKLPASAPLANPYVPFQLEGSEQYDPKQGLIRGTIYPGLDLPFMGMSNKKQLPITPTSELQTIAFAIQELALYLDTHREDIEALELYRGYQKMYREKSNAYTQRYGALCHKDIESKAEYTWLSDPWPWEFCNNKEG